MSEDGFYLCEGVWSIFTSKSGSVPGFLGEGSKSVTLVARLAWLVPGLQMAVPIDGNCLVPGIIEAGPKRGIPEVKPLLTTKFTLVSQDFSHKMELSSSRLWSLWSRVQKLSFHYYYEFPFQMVIVIIIIVDIIINNTILLFLLCFATSVCIITLS